MSVLIAAGSDDSDFADVVVGSTTRGIFPFQDAAVGTPVAGSVFQIAVKTTANQYQILVQGDWNTLVENGALFVPGTYGIRRVRSDIPVGVEVTGSP